MKNRPQVSGDSGVEEVNRRRTSIAGHKAGQNFGCRSLQPEFLEVCRNPLLQRPRGYAKNGGNHIVILQSCLYP